MKYEGKDIERLIPQRHPFMMVDEFEDIEAPESEESLTGASCSTSLSVRSDNYFMLPGQEMSETGLIEHIAQSASALAGHVALQQGAENPPVGMIAEVKHFECQRRPRAHEQLTTTIAMGFAFGPMTLCHGETRIGDGTICEADLKIFVR
ncbi:MAG: beta-hydroxyacyl-ACP dehydratase [Prevotella sp.]|nr:beta-hydroxyacyl-ACP dehydratase [Prevotella sp.]